MPESGKKLNELRVCDLKDELERRKLDTVGSKAALLERLQIALKEEGHNPSTHMFGSKDSPAKKQATPPTKLPEDVVIKEEPIEYDPSSTTAENEEDEDETNGTYEHGENHLIDEVGTVDDECVIIEDDDYDENVGEEEGDEEGEGEGEGEDAEEEEGDEENTGDGTNQDNEESINLTIGEDEQKLLHDEAPDDKDKSMTEEQTNAARKEREEKAAGKENKSENTKINSAGKDDKKGIGKDADVAKIKSKNDEKMDDSELKSSSKTSLKDDKEKSSTVSSNVAATTAAGGDTTKSVSSSKITAALSRNLWVSGLSSLTRASDLKMIFSKYGKVIGAKVVTNTRTPGTRCYGYVTMSSSNDASRCIEHLHRTELHGRIISVERTKNEIGGSTTAASNSGSGAAKTSSSSSKRRDDDKRTSGKDSGARTSNDEKKKGDDKKIATHRSNSGSRKDDGKKDDKSKRDEKDKDSKVADSKSVDSKGAAKDKDDKERSVTTSGKRPSRRMSRTDCARTERSRDHDREREQRQKERERERDRLRQREILSYQKIREERERQRLREKERELREEERRRREIRERQRQEEQRLADERKKLALERERLEREKAELLRLERERQKLEREKIELERLELKRQQMKIIQTREDTLKRPAKRTADDRYTAEVPERKRAAGNDSRFEAPPPPRFDAALVSSRSSNLNTHSYEKKRDDYSSSSSAKRGLDDYSSTKRADYVSKRDDYATSGTKRAAIDDYPPAPPKSSTDHYSKRSAVDYISSSGTKRALDDYSSSSKRDDYSSSKPQRDDYKREVEIRHIAPSGSGGGGSSYHASSLHKSSGSRYAEPELQVRSSVTSFRRIEDRSDVRTAGSGKRYESSTGYGGSSDRNMSSSNGVWAPSTSSHLGHSSGSGVPTMKSYVSNGMSSNMHSTSTAWPKSSAVDEPNWRTSLSSQDRYDRTYNERSGAYIDSSRTSSGLYGSSGRPAPDRYSATVSSRYDSSKY